MSLMRNLKEQASKPSDASDITTIEQAREEVASLKKLFGSNLNTTAAPAPPQPFRTFAAADAKGGCALDPAKTALVCIEFQNEFATEGGKLHSGVKGVMDTTGMLSKSVAVCESVRKAGGTVMMAPILFKADASDNPNKGLGILGGCAKDSLFTAGTWNGEFCDSMQPKDGDVVIVGKRGLDAFPHTTLEAELIQRGVETIALCGFLTNCCVESTMRTACEKGFNVITLTDCCATTSAEGQKGATEGTFGWFSKPMTAAEFSATLDQAPPSRGVSRSGILLSSLAKEGCSL